MPRVRNVSIRRRPGRFLFAFGRPDVLAARRAERCAKWEWSEEFLNKARPDKFGAGNYGAGDLYDDGLTRLERNQMVSGREGFLTGAAKLRYRRLTGQIQDADAVGGGDAWRSAELRLLTPAVLDRAAEIFQALTYVRREPVEHAGGGQF